MTSLYECGICFSAESLSTLYGRRMHRRAMHKTSSTTCKIVQTLREAGVIE